MGNQMFQYWAAKWISEKLGRPLLLAFHEPIQLNTDLYPNLGDLKIIQQLRTPPHNPDEGIYLGCNVYEQNTVDIDSIIEKHKTSNIPIVLDFHYEDYSNIRPREEWIKNLYKRSPNFPLTCNDSLVIHLRLGDIAHENIRIFNEYVQFALNIATQEKLPVIIVSEENRHFCTLKLKEVLEHNNIQVTLTNNNTNEYQKDFDIVSSAKVIVATNSTFTWWASFLNPFNPKVYIALSEKQPANFRNDFLFKRDSPDSWNIWDMDKNNWIKFVN
jgi:hypothetical protein